MPTNTCTSDSDPYFLPLGDQAQDLSMAMVEVLLVGSDYYSKFKPTASLAQDIHSDTINPPNSIPSHPPKPLPKPNPQPPLPAPPHQHLLSHPHNLKPPPPRPKRLTRRRPRQKPRRPLPPNPPRPPPRAHHLHPSQMLIPLIPRRPRRNRAGVRSRGGGREDVDLCCCCQLLPPKYGGKGGDVPPSDTSVSLVVGR